MTLDSRNMLAGILRILMASGLLHQGNRLFQCRVGFSPRDRRISFNSRGLERFHPQSLQISTSLEQVQAGLCGQGLLDVADGFDEGLAGAFGKSAKVRLQGREGHFDRVEVG